MRKKGVQMEGKGGGASKGGKAACSGIAKADLDTGLSPSKRKNVRSQSAGRFGSSYRGKGAMSAKQQIKSRFQEGQPNTRP